jgi:hypothetical protein
MEVDKSLKPLLCGCGHTQHGYYTLKRHESQFFLQIVFHGVITSNEIEFTWSGDECSNDDGDDDGH